MQSSVTHKSHPQPHFSLHQILHSLRLLHFIMSGTQIEAIYPSSYPENLCERCRGINAESLSSLAPGAFLDDDKILRKKECPLCRLFIGIVEPYSGSRSLFMLNSDGGAGAWLLRGGVSTGLFLSLCTRRRNEYGDMENSSWDSRLFVRSLKGNTLLNISLLYTMF